MAVATVPAMEELFLCPQVFFIRNYPARASSSLPSCMSVSYKSDSGNLGPACTLKNQSVCTLQEVPLPVVSWIAGYLISSKGYSRSDASTKHLVAGRGTSC